MRALGLLLGVLVLASSAGASICGDYRQSDLRDCASAYDTEVGDCYWLRAFGAEALGDVNYYDMGTCLAEALAT